ncbi:MAG TPA: methyltransferase [Opitutaceae bacterium]|jgi:SAM-dependent methyltransferase
MKGEPSVAPSGGDLPATMSSAMSSLTRYHDYLWSKVHPWLGSRVMEIGVGYGQYSRRILAEGRRLLACDIDEGHLRELKQAADTPMLATLRLDLESPEEARAAAESFRPDSIVLLNVLEHIGPHEKALAFLRTVAVPGARLILIVPALPVLFNSLDKEAGHHRRYRLGSLRRVATSAGWNEARSRYINLPGVPGWLLAGWLSRGSPSGTSLNAPSTNGLLSLYDRLFVGIARMTDPVAAKIGGLSALMVAVNGIMEEAAEPVESAGGMAEAALPEGLEQARSADS